MVKPTQKVVPPNYPPHRLQLLLLLDQELQHQVDVCQVQVLLVRIQGVLEYLPPGAILGDQRWWGF